VSFEYVIQQGGGFEDLVLEAFDGTVGGVGAASGGCTAGVGGCLGTTGRVQFNSAAWLTGTLDFTATSTSTTLRFSDFSGPLESGADTGSTNWALDAVSVVQTGGGGSAVPEPSTMALLGAGLMGILARQRAKAR
jgi:hypothetical protein